MNLINIVNINTHEFLKSQGFKCFKEANINNSCVYIYKYDNKLIEVLNTKFTSKDYFVGNKLTF